MKKRKLIFIFCTIVACFCMVSCNSNKSGNGTSNGSAENSKLLGNYEDATGTIIMFVEENGEGCCESYYEGTGVHTQAPFQWSVDGTEMNIDFNQDELKITSDESSEVVDAMIELQKATYSEPWHLTINEENGNVVLVDQSGMQSFTKTK